MSQLEETTNLLITSALGQISVLAADEPPTGTMLEKGLYVLNQLVGDWSTDAIHIPYVGQLPFTMTVGKSDYSVSNVDGVVPDVEANRIVSIEYANFKVQSGGQSIIYPLTIINRAEYYNNFRLQALQARPGFVFLDKQIDRSIVVFYPAPDQPYEVNLKCKFMIDKFEPNTLISNIPYGLQMFMRFALARQLKGFFPSSNWKREDEEEYQRLRDKFTQTNDNDMTIRSSAILESPRPFYWPNILAY